MFVFNSPVHNGMGKYNQECVHTKYDVMGNS